MIEIQIPSPLDLEIEANLLERAALEALSQAGLPGEADLSIVLTSNEQIQALNRAYLGEDRPTDVLSFPQDMTDPDTGRPYLGDVIIAYPQALAQAKAGGYPVLEELQLLAVHGVLHLLGYDHAEPDEEERMWAVQAAILNTLGVVSASRRSFERTPRDET